MKAFNKIILSLCAVVFLAACSSSDDYSAGQWNAADGYAKVAFAETSVEEELDPTDPTQTTLKLTRENTEGELTVPVTVLSNTDNVFVVSPAKFADGEAETEITVTFNNAEVGKPYTLSLAIEGEQYVSFYSKDVKMSYTVTRVKWNRVGYYIDEETGEKVEGMAMYTDDLVNVWYGVGTPVYPVPVEERDDMPGYFRMINAYGEYYPVSGIGIDDSQDYYLFIDATDPDHVIIPEKCIQSAYLSDGNWLVWSKAGNNMAKGETLQDQIDAGLTGKYENGKITFPAGSLIFGETEYGMTYSNNNGAFCLVLDPSLDLYTADITSDDFEWEVYGEDKELVSEKLGTKTSVTIYKGTCVNKTDDCDKAFEEAYGTAYKVEAPYAEGYDLYFCVNKKGQIVTPEGFDKQPIGIKALDKDVYVTFTTESSFEPKVITMNLNFTDLKGTLDYGTTDEVINLWEFKSLGTGTFTYELVFNDYDAEDNPVPYVESGMELIGREDGGLYRLMNWAGTEDEPMNLVFYWNQDTNEITVPAQNTGVAYGNYGDIYIEDRASYQFEEDEEQTPSYYDPKTKTFNFSLAYYVSAGCLNFGVETFKLDPAVVNAKKRVAAFAPASKSIRKNMKVMKGSHKKHYVIWKATPINVFGHKTGSSMLLF